MEHPPDIQWIELANGISDEQTAEHLRAHLEQCPSCRAMWEELKLVHRAMGSLEVAADEIDLTAKVLAAMDAPPSTPAWRIGPMTWRLAASVVIAAGLGAAVGAMAQPASQPGETHEAGAAEKLGLRQLQIDSPVGLAEFWFSMPTDAAGGKGTAG